MGSVLSSKRISKEELEMALNKAKEIVSSSPVVIFSKTYCGYSKRVKDLLTQLGAAYKAIELDEESKSPLAALSIDFMPHTLVHNINFVILVTCFLLLFSFPLFLRLLSGINPFCLLKFEDFMIIVKL